MLALTIPFSIAAAFFLENHNRKHVTERAAQARLANGPVQSGIERQSQE